MTRSCARAAQHLHMYILQERQGKVAPTILKWLMPSLLELKNSSFRYPSHLLKYQEDETLSW